jgi:hypothetical protein
MMQIEPCTSLSSDPCYHLSDEDCRHRLFLCGLLLPDISCGLLFHLYLALLLQIESIIYTSQTRALREVEKRIDFSVIIRNWMQSIRHSSYNRNQHMPQLITPNTYVVVIVFFCSCSCTSLFLPCPSILLL